MPERSVAYTNIRRALLSYVRDIPFGAVVEIATLASALNIPARHAAHILSRLSDDEAALVPWYRVIPRNGVFPHASPDRQRTARQIALLMQEGVPFVEPATVDMVLATRWLLPDTHRRTFWADIEYDSNV